MHVCMHGSESISKRKVALMSDLWVDCCIFPHLIAEAKEAAPSAINGFWSTIRVRSEVVDDMFRPSGAAPMFAMPLPVRSNVCRDSIEA